MKKELVWIGVVLLFFHYSLPGQVPSPDVRGRQFIDSLISANALQAANTELQTQIAYYLKNAVDSLPRYVRLVGSYNLAKNDWNIATSRAEGFVSQIKKVSTPRTQIAALIELSNLYFDARFHQKNYDASAEALQLARTLDNFEVAKTSLLEYNKGNALLYMGKYAQAQIHFLRSKKILDRNPEIALEQFYNTYNNLGRVYANLSMLDSANHYYKKALGSLNDFESPNADIYYRKAIIGNNLSLNYQNVGKTEEAIETLQKSAENFQKYVEQGDDESKKIRSKRNRLVAIDNLGTFFQGIGEYGKAIELINLSYLQKKRYLPEDDPDIIISKILLAEAHFSAKNFAKARTYINQVLVQIGKNPERLAYIDSYSKNVKAAIEEATGNFEEARFFYEKSESVLKKEVSRNYLPEELDGLIRMSQFYAKTGHLEKGLSLALEGYTYTHRPGFENELVKIAHTKNVADIHLKSQDYQKALKYGQEALSNYDEVSADGKEVSNYVKITFEKPGILLLRAKAKYHLEKNKSESHLKDILKELDEGIEILNKRRSLIITYNDLHVLLAENKAFFDFMKQLHLELYELTSDERYLKKVLEFHESNLYNRIRSRLNLTNTYNFKNIPSEVLKKEDDLKNTLMVPIKKNEGVKNYVRNTKIWHQFLDSLKTTYPQYYNLKYASLAETLDDLNEKLPKESTLVRYLRIQDGLYAYVANQTFSELFPLDEKGVAEKITRLNDYAIAIEDASELCEGLYENLWKPFASRITTKNVIIFPDAELFNLSFELLLSEKVRDFPELASKSLLAKHNISYNYSLYLMDKRRKTLEFKDDFLGFAPEFESKMKKEYQLAITDSIYLDQTYLTLLPQPFNLDLVKKYSKLFNGQSFLNEKASKQLFTQNAKEHKIIHIGTHAESNNVNPELSRLVFAKNVSDTKNINDNSLYTYEIYNQNLASNLAILTACETGKPSYQPGEGMISLAHAFNYAGSESILTSLWQIDEQSSTKILSFFYDYLVQGKPKDEALRLAKLAYVETAEGRTLHPQYWAGLILMGDTAPVELTKPIPWVWWVLFIACFLAIIYFYVRRKRKVPQKGEPSTN